MVPLMAWMPVSKSNSPLSTGIYRSQRQGDGWQSPQKVWLFNIVPLEGCACVQGNTIWYCAAVCGMTGMHHFYSEYEYGNWSSGQLSEVLNHADYEIGEFHVTPDGSEIYFHSNRAGGKGGNDLWVIEKKAAGWGDPVPLTALNTEYDEGFPFVTADGTELWFCGDSRIDVALPLGTPDYFGAIFYSTPAIRNSEPTRLCLYRLRVYRMQLWCNWCWTCLCSDRVH